MSALTSIHIRRREETTPFCDMPDCHPIGHGKMPAFGNEWMFLLGHPIGCYCRKHANEIRDAYESAHGTFEPVEVAA